MADFTAKVTAKLDTSGIKSQIQSLNGEKIQLDVDTSKLRSQIEKALKKTFKIKVSPDTSGGGSNSNKFNNSSSVSLTTAQLRQIEAAKRKSQIRASEFQKKQDMGVQAAKLKNIDKVETAQKKSDIKVSEAQRKQDIRDASRRERQMEADTRRIQREQEKRQRQINKLTNSDEAYRRTYGSVEQGMRDEYLANGHSIGTATKAGLRAVNAQKMQDFGHSLDDVTRAGARYVALPIAAATVASVKAFTDYETAFTGVRKTVDGTEEELQAVSDGLEQMALRVPVASVELAQIAQLGGQLGIPTKSLLKFTETVAALETATNLQGEEGASTLARFMNVVHEDYDNIDRVGAAIVDLGNNFATTESEIATMSQRLGSTGSIVGMSTSDILGYAAALSATGVKAEAGGSAMSRIWQDISQSVSEGGKGLKAYAKVSKMTAQKFAEDWKNDPTKAFNALLKGLKEAPDMIKALDDIGVNNIRDITALQNLANRYDLVEEALGRSNTAYKENVALSNEANRAYSTTASKLQLAKEAITQAGRSVGESLAPTVIDIAGGIQKAATGFANLSDGSKKFVTTTALTTAGALLAANGVAKMTITTAQAAEAFIKIKGILGAGKIATMLGGIGAAAPAILGVGAAIAVTAGAIYTYKKAAEHIRNQETGVYFLEQSKKVEEYGNKVSELTSLQKEIKDLQLIIKNPESSQAEIDGAKTRIQEIVEMLNKEYDLKINADTDNLDEVVNMLNKGETSKVIQEGYKALTDFEHDPLLGDSNKNQYKEAIGSLNEKKDRSKIYEGYLQDYDSLKSQYRYAQDEGDTESVKRIESELGKLAVKINESGGLLDSRGNKVPVGSTGDPYVDFMYLRGTAGQYAKESENAFNTIKNTNEGFIKDINASAQGMVSALYRGDKVQTSQLVDLFTQYGVTMNEAGADTGYLAQQFAISKQGTTDFQKIIDAGNIDNVITDYFAYTESIGTSTDKAVQGAALLKQGWTDASQVVKGTKKDVTALHDDMIKLGSEKGLSADDNVKNALKGTAMFASGFNSMQEVMLKGEDGVESYLEKVRELGKSDVTGKLFQALGLANNKGENTNLAGQAKYLGEIASSLNLLPDNKTIAVDFKTGDISVIDNLPDSKTITINTKAEVDSALSEIESQIPEGETVTYTVNAEGNIAVLNEVGEVIAELQGNDEVELEVTAEGKNLQVLDEAGAKLGELDENGDKTVTVGVEYEEGEIPDVEIPPETGEITYNPFVIRPVINSETGEVTYNPFVIRPVINDETGNVTYTPFFTPALPPVINNGVANYVLGKSPDKVDDADGTANYSMGTHPTKAPTIWGVANYTIGFVGGGRVDGTAHAQGTAFSDGSAGRAFKQGDWGTKSSGIALGGELGEELIVRDGKFFTIGSDSAGFFAYKKGDIIFNAEQTKQIFEKGKITHGKRRGRAFAKGTYTEEEMGVLADNSPSQDTKRRFYRIENKDLEAYVSMQDSEGIIREIENARKEALAKDPIFDTSEFYKQMQDEYHEQAEYLLSIDPEKYKDEIQGLQQKWWEAEDSKIKDSITRHEKIIQNIEYARDMALEEDPDTNVAEYYEKMQNEYRRQAEYLRSMNPEKYKEEIQNLSEAWWEAEGFKAEANTERRAEIIRDMEHSVDMILAKDPIFDVTERYEQMQDEYHRQAEYLRSINPEKYKEEIQELEKKWWETEEAKVEGNTERHEGIIRDIEHSRDMALAKDPYLNTEEYYKQLQEEYHRHAEYLRSVDPEKYKEEIQNLSEAWWEAESEKAEQRWESSNRWIEDRNTYNDWGLFDDSEIKAWERVVKWLNEDYPNDLERIREAEQKLFEARKDEFNKATNLGSTYLESQKTLLQAHFDVTNSIAEARHKINKELETSKSMYEYLDEETRKLLFNQEDYKELSSELNRIEKESLRLQSEYEDNLQGATLETIESITSEYQMQYETLMKSYEIAKADLEVAKKKQKLNNVLNERNVRMFINGQWQWVANTENVMNAKSELADAEYAQRVEEAGLTQQQSIDNLTRQQDELGVVIKKFENGIIGLDDAVSLAEMAISSIPSAVKSMLNNSRSSSRSSSGGINYSLKQIDAMTPSERSAAWAGANEESKYYLHEANKRDLSATNTYDSATGVWTKKAYATGTRYTSSGLALMGEDGSEIYINSNGRLIPINQPTIGSISEGGIVFNSAQMQNLRTMWDMSNLNSGTSSLIGGAQPQQIDQSQDNRIIINGMTVDNGSSDGQALISALRRYVGNH